MNIITDPSSPPSFFRRLFTAYSLWAWGGITTSIIICCTVTWLHYQQRDILELASADLTTIRQARIDLAKGFLHVSLGDYSASPFNRDQGLALLNQAMASLESSVQKVKYHPIEPESLVALQNNMQLFQGHLVEWSRALERKPNIETALRSVFYDLERQADHIDSNIQQKLHQQYIHLDYIFFLTITGASLLLAGFCSAIYVAGRHQEKNARALREKEHHFRSYFERAMVGMAATSPSKGWLEVNPALLEMMGYTTAEFAGKTWAELTHPDDLADDVAQFEQLLAGQLDGYSMEKRFFRKNGEIVWTVMAVQAVRHPDGSVNYCVAIIEDISDRKRDEEALKQSEEHYRLLFHSNPLPMWMYDLETLAFLEVNRAAIDHYGYSREEFLAMTIKDIRPAEDLPKLLESVQRVSDGLDHAGNWRHLRQDGSIIDVEITSHTLEFEGRKAELVLSYDISDRKKAEADLREGEERLRFTLESCHIGTWDLDLGDHTADRSLEHARIFGYAQLQPIWTKEMFLEHILPDDRAPVNAKILQAIETQSDFSFECRIRRLDSQIRWIWVAGRYRLDPDAKARRLTGVVQDITERKVHEAEIERLSRLYATMSQINQIIVRVGSHEELTREVARIAVEFGGSKIAWVGRYDSQTREVIPVGWAGKQWEVIRNIRHSLADTAEQPCLCGPVILENRSCVFNDLSASPEMSEWLTKVGQAGIRAAAVFPIRMRDTVWGVFGVYEGEPNVFQDKEIALLEEAAMDIGYAIEHIENEAQRRLAEDALRESEERFRALFEQAAVGVAEIESATGRFLRVNQRYCDIVGYSHEEMLDLDFQTISHPDDLTADLVLMEQLTSGAIREFAMEKRYRRKDGVLVWVAMTVSPLWLRDTAVTRHVAVVQDITDRKRAEASLQESEQHVRAFIDNAKSLVWIKDLDGRFLVANPYTESVLGLPEDQIVGRTVFEIFPDEYAYPYTDNDRQVLEAGQAITFEETAMLRDGQHTYISVKFPLRDSVGRTYAIGAICTDITDRKRAEEALLRKEVHLRTLVNTLPDLVWLKDPHGAYLSCNPRFESFFGATEAEVVGKTDYDFLDRQLADFFRANDDIAVAAGGPQVNEEEVTFASDGHHELLETIKTPMFDADERLIGVLGIARDITMRRQQEKERANLEAQLLQAQKMESVGRLAGGVAHDFNNMLGVILGTTDMLLEQIGPMNPVHSDLVEIRKAGERSADLTRQLLAFARKQTVAPKVIDLNRALDGMAKMLERLIGEDIALEWIQAEDVWPIKIDPGQIDQLLANLCVNARDAIAGVGRITIETANRVFDEAYCMNHVGWLPGEYVMLAVSDNGCGMDSETMSHLFEPFYTTKELGKGTGLGLATAYGVVKQNEGFIDVSSEIGKGTTFRIYLPRHQAKTALLPEMKPDSPHETGHEIILLVEDEPAILKMTARMLEREGYTVVAASTPGEAIRLANEHHGDIHLLITDVVMPEMNGRDLAKNILSLYPHLKRLFMSGYTADIIAHHGVLDRGVCFLQKPFSKSDLTAKVREILDGVNATDVENESDEELG